ncbi:SseB family protein [Streptomyces sp. NPDC059786]|uniref:SseB family protein n=1 Tax=Streptomyces sp. NPDC059786 TaxID=3346946 RepID=UPI0036465B20
MSTSEGGAGGVGGPADDASADTSAGAPADALADAVRRARAGSASPQDVFEAFLAARVYCERPESPGFLTVDAPGSSAARPRSSISTYVGTLSEERAEPLRLVPVFSSLEHFARYAGSTGAWFSTTGADVLDLLPPALDLWLDPGADHSVRLASAAVGTTPVLTISYRAPYGDPDRDRSASA